MKQACWISPVPLLLTVAFITAAVATPEPPRTATNPATGAIEIVDSPWTGANFDIRHVVQPTSGSFEVTNLTTNGHNDQGPRLAIGATGDTQRRSERFTPLATRTGWAAEMDRLNST
jgi:hypothetical protein